MRRVNLVVTLVLAVAAIGMWTLGVFQQAVGYRYLPDIQRPCAVTLSAAACLGWVLLWLSARRGDHECRCRRCGYILRGLAEPRCPECGERI